MTGMRCHLRGGWAAAVAALHAAGVTVFVHDDNKPDTTLPNGTIANDEYISHFDSF